MANQGADFQMEKVPLMAYPTDPAAGAEFSYTVPTGYVLRLYGFGLGLTTSADVASRNVVMTIVTPGGKTLLRCPVTSTFANQTADRGNYYNFLVGIAASDAADQVDRTAILPDELWLPAATVISTTTTNLDNTAPKDQYTCTYWIGRLVNLK
jgi:hypothetical protein